MIEINRYYQLDKSLILIISYIIIKKIDIYNQLDSKASNIYYNKCFG